MAGEEVDLSRVPQKHLSEVQKQYIQLRIEKARLNRERSILVLNKGLLLFFAFLVFGIILFLNKVINQMYLNVFVLVGLSVLILSILPYAKMAKKEEETIGNIIDSLLK